MRVAGIFAGLFLAIDENLTAHAKAQSFTVSPLLDDESIDLPAIAIDRVLGGDLSDRIDMY